MFVNNWNPLYDFNCRLSSLIITSSNLSSWFLPIFQFQQSFEPTRPIKNLSYFLFTISLLMSSLPWLFIQLELYSQSLYWLIYLYSQPLSTFSLYCSHLSSILVKTNFMLFAYLSLFSWHDWKKAHNQVDGLTLCSSSLTLSGPSAA